MRNNFFLVSVMIGVGLLFGLPYLLIPRLLGERRYFPLGGGEGPRAEVTVEEIYTYIPEVQEIVEGRFPVRETQLVEHKSASSPFIGETFPALLMAGISRLAGSVERSFMMADFIFPPLSVLLVYLLTRKLGVGSWLSLLTAVTTIVAGKLISLLPYPGPTWEYLINTAVNNKGIKDFLFFSRSFHPQLSFPLFILTLLLIVQALENRRPYWRLLAGVGVGLQFYTYVFNWIAIAGTLAVLSIWAVASRDRSRLMKLLIIEGVGFLIAFPYLVEMQRFKLSAGYQSFFLKNTLSQRSFLPISARYILLGLVAFLITRSEKRSISLMVLLATLLTTALLPEITNLYFSRDPEAKHWIRRLMMPLSFSLAAFVSSQIYQRQQLLRFSPRLQLLLVILGLFLVFQFGIRVQVDASIHNYLSYHRLESKQQLYDWININLEPDEVVASLDPTLVAEIPAFTKVNNAVPVTTRSVATTDESLDRFLKVAGLYQISPETLAYLIWSPAILEDDPVRVQELYSLQPDLQDAWVTRIFYFTAYDEAKPFYLSERRREKIVSRYRQELELRREVVDPWQIDFILFGPTEKILTGQDSLAGRFPVVFENEEYKLYRYEP